MRADAVRAALRATIEGLTIDGGPRSARPFKVIEASQQEVTASGDRVVTITLEAGPTRTQALYGCDLFDVEYVIRVHAAAHKGVEDRLGMDLERIGARLPTATGGDLYVVDVGTPVPLPAESGQAVAGLPVRCTYRVDASIVVNS